MFVFIRVIRGEKELFRPAAISTVTK